MKTDHREKQILKVALLAILFYFAILRIDSLMAILAQVFRIAKPFLYGGALAFVINVPMKKIEALLEKRKIKKGRRGIALLLTLVLIVAAVSCFLLIVVPQLASALTTIIAHLQRLVDSIPALLESHSGSLSIVEEQLAALDIDWQNLGQNAINHIRTFAIGFVDGSTGLISGIISGFTTCLLSFIFSVYLVLGKEKIGTALKETATAILPAEISSRLFYVLSVANRTFSSFLSGQCLEAVILGAIFVVAMSLFRLPYAFLIGIIIGVTALIPVVGAFIGCGIGVVLILLESPLQAVWFVVLFLVLQQIEGNVIYPRVVGSSIGLPSVLVFMSVLIGGNLMGVMGMLLFIPSVSVAYTLIKEYVISKRLVTENTETE